MNCDLRDRISSIELCHVNCNYSVLILHVNANHNFLCGKKNGSHGNILSISQVCLGLTIQ